MRFQFLGAQTDESGQEWCYIFDTQTGETVKSIVKAGAIPASRPALANKPMFTVPTIAAPSAADEVKKGRDPTGEVESTEDRAARQIGRAHV